MRFGSKGTVVEEEDEVGIAREGMAFEEVERYEGSRWR